MTRNPLSCILSPDLLQSLARDATAQEMKTILRTLEIDQTFRLARAEMAARQGPVARLAAAASVGGTPHRTIYDQKHSQKTTPGTLVRAEGDPPVADASVNAAYDNFGSTYKFYWEVFARDSIDGQGMPINGLVTTKPTTTMRSGTGKATCSSVTATARCSPTPPKASTSSGTN